VPNDVTSFGEYKFTEQILRFRTKGGNDKYREKLFSLLMGFLMKVFVRSQSPSAHACSENGQKWF
jgi:hypothetical protein